MIGLIKRLFSTKKQSPKWQTQYAEWQASGEKELLHFWRSDKGIFEIYDDGESFLLLFPKSIGIPAELFNSIGMAKERAEEVCEWRLHYETHRA